MYILHDLYTVSYRDGALEKHQRRRMYRIYSASPPDLLYTQLKGNAIVLEEYVQDKCEEERNHRTIDMNV